MASRDDYSGLNDAHSDLPVVFCHACAHEWYQNMPCLRCPECGCDVIEIVDSGDDPREIHGYRPLASPTLHQNEFPELEEAEPHDSLGSRGFRHRRGLRIGTDRDDHYDPGIGSVMRDFVEMVQELGPTETRNGTGATGYDTGRHYVWPSVRRTTMISGSFPGGAASVTIISGSSLGRQQADSLHENLYTDPFQAIFSNVLRDLDLPQGEHPGASTTNFTRGINDFLNMIGSAHSGDAVHSQEALEHIITQLMEANPQSNAAPPASEEALRNLDRKKVDEILLQGKSSFECTICIEDMSIGEQAVVLPCCHWFHEACVLLWLREHNTCPICRTSIESERTYRTGKNNDNAPSQPASASGLAHGMRSPTIDGTDMSTPRGFRTDFSENLGVNIPRQAGRAVTVTANNRARMLSTPSARGLDDAIRVVSNIQTEQAHARGTSFNSGHNIAGFLRRTSASPASPRFNATENLGARTRQRSPSYSSRQEQTDRSLARQTNQGPLGWLRERFSGGGSFQSGPNREEER